MGNLVIDFDSNDYYNNFNLDHNDQQQQYGSVEWLKSIESSSLSSPPSQYCTSPRPRRRKSTGNDNNLSSSSPTTDANLHYYDSFSHKSKYFQQKILELRKQLIIN